MENKKTLQYITAACFALLAVNTLITLVRLDEFAIFTLLVLISYALIAVAIILPMPVFAAIGTGISVFVNLRSLINFITAFGGDIFDYDFLFFAALSDLLGIACFVLLLITCLNKKNAKTLGIVAAALYFVRTILLIIEGATFSFRSYIATALIIAGAVLLGMVFSDNSEQSAAATVSTAVTPTTDYSDAIEKLTKLKSLLDAGIISQEEFDAKKAEILR